MRHPSLVDVRRRRARPNAARDRCSEADDALDDRETITLARPGILGFTDEKVVTHQLSKTNAGIDYYFAVVAPVREDGLMFFSFNKGANLYTMHRTGMHLRRLVSAQNSTGQLSSWDGRDADRDFSAQLAQWA